MNREDFKYLKIIIPISLIAFFSIIWIRPADLMEARNFITAREMIESLELLNMEFLIVYLKV